ncbi:MAG TPA: twin-arginine translocation signal domain-containing protein [Halococcus sp.]|nr:twin-arginine translocation signal domain-containing protein [Halococcus sp.]
MSSSTQLSRRQFLAGCGAVGAAAASSPVVTAHSPATPSHNPQIGRKPPVPFGEWAGIDEQRLTAEDEAVLRSGLRGDYISAEGRAEVAATNRRFAQQAPRITKTVHAVRDLGLDPTGGEAINGKLEVIGDMANARIVFPSDGVFKLTDMVGIRFDGAVDFQGNGCTFKLPPDTQIKSFNFVCQPGTALRDFTIDQSATGSLQEFTVQADSGVTRVHNVRIKGYAPHTRDGSTAANLDAMFSPMALTEDAVLQATNFTAVGGTAAGMHDENDLPPGAIENTHGGMIGIWIGASNLGTVQLQSLALSGWSNGIYGGRTPGRYLVSGGAFVNNYNTQVRLGGGPVVDGASMLLDDRLWEDKGPFKIGHQGVHAIRVDSKNGGNQRTPAHFRNIRVRAKSMREGSSLANFEDISAPGIFDNCWFTNHLDRPVILAVSPSGGPPQPVLAKNCLFDGSSPEAIMIVEDRPQSRIQQSCIQTPDAGPEDIQGAQIGEGVGFGKKCKTGLRAPKKVGTGGKLSSLPAPSNSGSFGGLGADRNGPSKGVMIAVVDGIFMLLLVLFGTIVLFVGTILGALGALAAMLGGD